MVAAKNNRGSYSTKFGTYLRKTRTKMFPKLSGRKFAIEVGITGAYLSNIELGKVPPPMEDVVIAIADKLEENRHKLLRMAGHIDPDLVPIIRDMSPEHLELVSMYEKFIEENDINVEMKQVIGLMSYATNFATSEANAFGNILREMAELIECLDSKNVVSPELQSKMDKGLQALREGDESNG